MTRLERLDLAPWCEAMRPRTVRRFRTTPQMKRARTSRRPQ